MKQLACPVQREHIIGSAASISTSANTSTSTGANTGTNTRSNPRTNTRENARTSTNESLPDVKLPLPAKC